MPPKGTDHSALDGDDDFDWDDLEEDDAQAPASVATPVVNPGPIPFREPSAPVATASPELSAAQAPAATATAEQPEALVPAAAATLEPSAAPVTAAAVITPQSAAVPAAASALPLPKPVPLPQPPAKAVSKAAAAPASAPGAAATRGKELMAPPAAKQPAAAAPTAAAVASSKNQRVSPGSSTPILADKGQPPAGAAAATGSPSGGKIGFPAPPPAPPTAGRLSPAPHASGQVGQAEAATAALATPAEQAGPASTVLAAVPPPAPPAATVTGQDTSSLPGPGPAAAGAGAAGKQQDEFISAASTMSSGSWGGWGIERLGNKLQQVALGAAKDLQELTASVQQVVAEVVAAEDVTEVDKLSAYQVTPSHPPAVPASAAAAPPATVTARRDSESKLTSSSSSRGAAGVMKQADQEELLEEEEQRRQQVLQQLQGPDTQLESGLKAIDEQVDMLAASVAKGLGSLWGGLNSVAKTSWTVGAAITNKVEAAAQEVVKELRTGLEEGVTAVAPSAVGTLSLTELAARAEKGLEAVGRNAAQFLDPQFALGKAGGVPAAAGGRNYSASDWAATFDSCFELYGGLQACEELEQLSSECAHVCNRARAQLQQMDREQIDRSLAQLMPLFDLSLQLQQQQQGGSNVPGRAEGSEEDSAACDAVQDAIEQLYLPVVALCKKGKYKAGQVQQEAQTAAPAAAAATTGVQAAAGMPGGQEIEPDTSGAAPAAAGTASNEGDGDSSISSPVEKLLVQLLTALRAVAVKSLAEVAAGQLMLLLALGRSIAAVPRYGKPLDDGLEWPAEADKVAGIIRQQADIMLLDLQQLAACFKATAAALLETLQAAMNDAVSAAAAGSGGSVLLHSAEHQQKQVVDEVQVDCTAAVAHVRDGFGKLLYVVLLSSLHRSGPQQEQNQAHAHDGQKDNQQTQKQPKQVEQPLT